MSLCLRCTEVSISITRSQILLMLRKYDIVNVSWWAVNVQIVHNQQWSQRVLTPDPRPAQQLFERERNFEQSLVEPCAYCNYTAIFFVHSSKGDREKESKSRSCVTKFIIRWVFAMAFRDEIAILRQMLEYLNHNCLT